MYHKKYRCKTVKGRLLTGIIDNSRVRRAVITFRQRIDNLDPAAGPAKDCFLALSHIGPAPMETVNPYLGSTSLRQLLAYS